MNINNKVAIVTGASSGIGKSIVYALVKAKVRVTIIARNIDMLNSIVTELDNNGNNVIAIGADLCNEDELIKAIEDSHNHWGQTDILINNAACCIPSSFHSGKRQDWQHMWQLNVFAPSLAIQEVLRYFDKDQGGHIINISSTSAYRIVQGGSFYSATKFALRAITETLRKELVELNSKTRVSSISPGLVNTGFANSNDVIAHDNFNKDKLDPEDIADTVLYILKTKSHVAIQDIILRSTKQYN